MGFKVTLTSRAQSNFDDIINYLLYELKSKQAAMNVMEDMEHTIERLSRVADVLKLCDDPDFYKLGYRTIRFKRHNYFMLYRIRNDTVFVDAIYHDLQDYENMHK